MLWTPQAGRTCGTAARQSQAPSTAAGFLSEIVRFILAPTTAHSMRLVFRLSINAGGRLAFALIIAAGAAWAQLPDGPGKRETLELCSKCHEFARSLSLRQDRAGWQATVNKMASLGARGTDKDFATVVEYLATNFPGDELPKLNVNKAAAIDFETRL